MVVFEGCDVDFLTAARAEGGTTAAPELGLTDLALVRLVVDGLDVAEAVVGVVVREGLLAGVV